MRQIKIPLPEIAIIAGTRAAFGVGIGLLIADRLTRGQRHAAGWALVAFGALTTLPLVADVFGRQAGLVPPIGEPQQSLTGVQ